MGGNAFYFAFSVNGQQPDLIILLLEVVNHPRRRFYLCLPLSNELFRRRLNQGRPCLLQRTGADILQALILIIRKIIIHILCKRSGFNKLYENIIRLRRRIFKTLFCVFQAPIFLKELPNAPHNRLAIERSGIASPS